MSDFGLSPEHKSILVNVLSSFSEIDEGIVFGSRAMGNYKPGSDIDIVLKSAIKIPLEKIVQINSAIEQTTLPYKVDLIDFQSINNDSLKEHITTYGQPLFAKS